VQGKKFTIATRHPPPPPGKKKKTHTREKNEWTGKKEYQAMLNKANYML